MTIWTAKQALAGAVLCAALATHATCRADDASDDATASSSSVASAPTGGSSADVLDALKQIATTTKDEYHMQPVRVVHARAQGDSPVWMKDRFISSIFKDDYEKGYQAVFDGVNTASVEGALMYVQAECVNQNMRSKDDRCKRKNNVNNIVFYELEIVQTNETIAQYQESWDIAEYGPQISLDTGKCTPQGDKLPNECLQYNGAGGQPNLGPFVGALSKNESRAPFTGTIWFSFPDTCPDKTWKEKTEECRAKTRKGLCDIGQKPNGIDCTFSYRVLGWVPIDDIVGITSIPKDDGSTYKNFTEWCMASEDNVEYEGDQTTNEWSKGLDFWSNPLDATSCDNRTKTMLDVYSKIQSGTFKSGQIDPEQVKHFVPLPTPEQLAKKNPDCYKNVKGCATGCTRAQYSQVCTPCTAGSGACKSAPSSFKFPTLAKAPGSSAVGSGEASSSGVTSGDGTDGGGSPGGKKSMGGKSSDSKKKTGSTTSYAENAVTSRLLAASLLAMLVFSL